MNDYGNRERCGALGKPHIGVLECVGPIGKPGGVRDRRMLEVVRPEVLTMRGTGWQEGYERRPTPLHDKLLRAA
jgi:hypothetical protein